MLKMINDCSPLEDSELEQLTEMLMKYGGDDDDNAVLSASELDGFFTAVISSPQHILHSTWFPAVWGGEDNIPDWDSLEEVRRFMDLSQRHWNYIAETLLNDQTGFMALLIASGEVPNQVLNAEDWSFGYMNGVALAQWPKMPPQLQKSLDVIALHGLEENFSRLDKLTLEQHQASIEPINRSVVAIYNHWLALRAPGTTQATPTAEHQTPVRNEVKVGRNDPCPCGSGKKFKKCCMS
ncbi:MAG: hypothetical protein ACI8WB_005097 [Phenylobacterium sp.]|jgi:uncharacterized protein